MQALFDAWLEYIKLTGAVSASWAKGHDDRWRLHLKNSLGAILARDVTRAHLAAALDAMSRKGIREETRKALTTLNLMLDYGLTRRHIEQNPARMLKPKDFSATANRPRARVLNLKELRKLWKALNQAVLRKKGVARTSVMTPITASAIKILILTGARRGEVAGMRWDELNLKEGTWALPEERTKNNQEHTVYLPKFAVQLIKDLKLLAGQSEFVFDTGQESGHIHTDSLTTALSRLRKSQAKKENEDKVFWSGWRGQF